MHVCWKSACCLQFLKGGPAAVLDAMFRRMERVSAEARASSTCPSLNELRWSGPVRKDALHSGPVGLVPH